MGSRTATHHCRTLEGELRWSGNWPPLTEAHSKKGAYPVGCSLCVLPTGQRLCGDAPSGPYARLGWPRVGFAPRCPMGEACSLLLLHVRCQSYAGLGGG